MSEHDEMVLAERAVQRLADNMDAAKLRLDRARAEAAQCLSDPGSVLPQVLQDALLDERRSKATYDEATAKYRAESDALEKRRVELVDRRADEQRKASKAAYEKALGAYRVKCDELIPMALEVRRLGRAAGVFMPHSSPGDLLFDTDSDLFVAGHPLPIWRHGSL
ncbi:hypothetical protein ACI2VP_01030 [Ralstonia nicotianae]|uniref:hypothetical protein n=1 Tax=Ralstonia solanacearum species complex TaxID=3116862 RepID=UPI002005B4E2|nr:hypothetical protein [Ralstonia pseudosolanacearum]